MDVLKNSENSVLAYQLLYILIIFDYSEDNNYISLTSFQNWLTI